MSCTHRLVTALMIWLIALSLWATYEPVDRQFGLLASLLPVLFVLILAATYRHLCLSPASYILITLFLTLHMVGVHYTYAQTPIGGWLDQTFHLGRNHYDRVVHFSFGLLLTYPIEELFRITSTLRGWLLYYLSIMTILGLSGLWEIIESWVAQTVRPELGLTYLGSQGDLWDAQKDMAAALYGSLLCVGGLLFWRVIRKRPEIHRKDLLADSIR